MRILDLHKYIVFFAVLFFSGCSTSIRIMQPEETSLDAQRSRWFARGLTLATDTLSDRPTPLSFTKMGDGFTRFLQFRAHEGEVTALHVMGDGKTVLSAGADGSFAVSKLGQSISGHVQVFVKTLLFSDSPITAISVDPNHHYAALGRFSSVVIYDLNKNIPVGELTRARGGITSIDWHKDGKQIAVGLVTGDVFIWKVAPKEKIFLDSDNSLEIYLSAVSPVDKVIFHPKGRILFAGKRDGSIDIWKLIASEKHPSWIIDNIEGPEALKSGSKKESFPHLRDKLNDFAFDELNEVIWVATANGNLRHFNLRGLRENENYQNTSGELLSVAHLSLPVNNNGKILIYSMIITSGRDQRIRIWCIPGGEIKASMILHHPLIILASQSNVGMLWGGDKTGKLSVFNAMDLTQSEKNYDKLLRCNALSKR